MRLEFDRIIVAVLAVAIGLDYGRIATAALVAAIELNFSRNSAGIRILFGWTLSLVGVDSLELAGAANTVCARTGYAGTDTQNITFVYEIRYPERHFCA